MRRWWLMACVGLATACPSWRGSLGTTGEIPVAGLVSPASVRIDPGGVVHIRAATDADAVFALGWVHARERLVELDWARRIAFGDTAAWIGDRGVPYDTFARALDLRSHAEQVLLEAGPEERTLLVAYTDGVNAAVTAMPALPPAHRKAGLGFAPFTPVDVLGILDVEAMRGSGNLPDELAALGMRSLDTASLDALIRAHGPPVDGAWEDLRRAPIGDLTPEFMAWAEVWAVRPRAAAALAVGPVLAAQRSEPPTPRSPMLIVDVRGRTLTMAGASIPGVPAVWVGRGDAVAWALLPGHADAFDLVRVSRGGEWQYRLHGADRVLERPEHTLRVRGDGPRTVAPPVTAIGPLVTREDAEQALALRWAGRARTHRTLPALWGLARASDVQGALAALDAPLVGAWRAVIADEGGTVADAVVGSVVRRRGVTGRVPHDGLAPDDTWQGWADRLPRVVQSGAVATVGERPDRPAADVIGTGFPDPRRAARLRARLAEGLSAEEAWTLLGDTTVGRPVGLLADVAPQTPMGLACRDVLAAWDGDATDVAGVVVWAALRDGLVDAALDGLPTDARVAWRRYAPRDADPPPGAWQTDRASIVADTLDRVCTALAPALGDDPSAWRWHAVHRVVATSPVAPSPHDDGVGVSGTGGSIFATGWRMDAPDWNADEVPAVRLAVDLVGGTALVRADVATRGAALDLFDPRGSEVRLVPR